MSRRLTAAAALASVAALAGCGGGADTTDLPPAAPAAAAIPAPPVPATPLAVGDVLTPGPRTPAGVTRALSRRRVLVVGFVLSRPDDDRAASHALARLRRSGPGASGVDYLIYRVDRTRSFGDLPEALDVEATPTVAVIGRDGRLRNRFSGWTDAVALRQAVAAAKGGDARTAARGGELDGPPQGSPAGIALARRVNARYAAVPGVRMAGSAIDDRLGPAEITLDARLRRGRLTGWSGAFTVGALRLEMATASGGLRARSAGAACWAGLPASDSVVGLGGPMIPLSGMRVGVPRRDGAHVSLALAGPDGTTVGTYRVDARTARVVAVDAASLSVRVTDLTRAPAPVPAQPLCADPAGAFAGLAGPAAP